jgi:uncharacterized membrane protein YcaP (DUF421 family)
VLVVGTLAYAVLVLLLRATGKRTLSKMNAFDLVVTVALGSTLATVLLSKDVALAEGVLAFALLIFLQFAITWLSVRSERIQALVKAEPRLLLYCGHLLPEALRRERVTEEEVRAAARSQGIASLDEVAAVVLETDGSFSVLRRAESGGTSALANVAGYACARVAVGEPSTAIPRDAGSGACDPAPDRKR